MKNLTTFYHIEQRSDPNKTNHVRISAAYYTWLGNRGHETLLSICEELQVSFSDVVDFACEAMKKDYPQIKFPPKRQPITPEFDIQAMARIEAATYFDPDNSPTFEIFLYLANPKKL